MDSGGVVNRVRTLNGRVTFFFFVCCILLQDGDGHGSVTACSSRCQNNGSRTDDLNRSRGRCHCAVITTAHCSRARSAYARRTCVGWASILRMPLTQVSKLNSSGWQKFQAYFRGTCSRCRSMLSSREEGEKRRMCSFVTCFFIGHSVKRLSSATLAHRAGKNVKHIFGS